MPRKPKGQPGPSLETTKEKQVADNTELAILAGKDENAQVWVENLLAADSVYHSDKTKDKYAWTPTGTVGSIIPMPVKVAKEGYLRRAVLRGKVRFLTDEEEAARSANLVFQDEAAELPDRLMQALEAGASDVGARYTKKGLSDDGTEGQSIPAKEVLKRVSNKGQSMVRRSEIKAEPLPSDAEPDFKVIIEEPVKEGDPNWKPDAGNA